ncbi:hypothetical protein SAMN06265373_104149 [Shimia sagamensis]|uniref:Uncharacterized protein n=1 Tax=Shimia sagamensis TaxID=1566352 RepID=A0ABY1NYQ8_9RHOB|nr:hypothetical protein SAMN06265373_104149 [Shimia sagamensis]
MSCKYPAATPHAEIREVFPDIYHVTGSVTMAPARGSAAH